MRYILQHINTITGTYNGDIPLAHFIKNYFKQHPILGSRDRKMLSAMAYSWYRASKGLPTAAGMEEKIQRSLQLCGNELPRQPFVTEGAGAKLQFDSNALFPFDMPLSTGITREQWLASMLVQPNLFIRLRKDQGKLLSMLNAQQIPYTHITDNCISLPNGAKIDTLLPPDSYVVQDASSQRTGTFFAPGKNEMWYDCCSGAGGKSLLLKDMERSVRLTITDRRETIIYNLHQRFKLYRHEPPIAHVTDVSDPQQLTRSLGTKKFDNIICDAPCSGSGTWARTPEQLYFFDPASIDKFAALQASIATNVAHHLKEGSRLIYITCSVFRKGK